jgi:uncharacterized protein (TIGR00299 family) protein
MKIAWIDCFAGISGDMTLGSLIDCGVPLKYIRQEIKKLGLTGYSIDVSETVKSHITAKQVNIVFDVSEQPDRKYLAIKSMLEESKLSPKSKDKALKAFEILGKAEAAVHGIPLNEVHFHEIGAIDSIIDLVGSIIGFEYLEIDKIFSSPVPLGTGFAETEHGRMPVPSPAALEVLAGYPVIHRDSGYEMTTPTGATLIRVLSEGLLPEKFTYSVKKTGYGSGTRITDKWPNVLRLIIGEHNKSETPKQLFVLETNIDDLNPEIYPYLIERLLSAQVKDVYLTPVIMKKGRPGTKLTVLVDESGIAETEKIIFTETSTIGIRRYPVDRTTLIRQTRHLKTRFGQMVVKVISRDGEEVIHAEYEECRRIAREKGINLIDVYRELDAMNVK